ncbi:DUF4268 domain-containing protein [Streptosporangium sp. NPDC002544]|uniref:DUF4268 domain-containing protein n=1 Tax=Streptosporangium sp. NPDC002544 TaxID=3154538 RepID=UPI0033230E57
MMGKGKASRSGRPDLSRLTPVDPREVWRHEARDFTPWLLENADVLGEELGMDLVLKVAEHPVGGFLLDLIGVDEATNERVIVENQLTPTDHAHLGQLLTYAGGTAPTNVVWLATMFRDEHRAALEWLNARTDENTRFFGVEIRLVRVVDSPPAPMFRVVAQPNDWGKQVKRASSANATSRNLTYQQFWARFLDRTHSERTGWTRARKPPAQNWFEMPTGVTGFYYTVSFSRQGLRSELYLAAEAAINEHALAALIANQDQLETAYGGQLTYEPLPDKIACRVADYRSGSIDQASDWDAYFDWFLDSQTRLRKAINGIGGLPQLYQQAISTTSNPRA